VDSSNMRLTVIHGPNQGSEYILQDQETTIGRSANNNIVLPSPEISRRHAHLWQDGDSILLEDLGSTNGTFVNNARLYKQVTLHDGDEIQFGDTFRLLYTSIDGLTRSVTNLSVEENVESSTEGPDNESHLSTATSADQLSVVPDEQGIEANAPLISYQQRATILRLAVAVALLIVIYLFTFLFLDSYDKGKLIYCGNLKPFFSLLLGPFGFNPICP
jgi:pSer/pThr/pTyr-binding forkhead associated (FHA) protein